MRTHLCHQKDFVTMAFQRFSHHRFASIIVIIPRIVEKRQPALDGLLNDSFTFLVARVQQVRSSETQNGD
jgi:hypothetical protein